MNKFTLIKGIVFLAILSPAASFGMINNCTIHKDSLKKAKKIAFDDMIQKQHDKISYRFERNSKNGKIEFFPVQNLPNDILVKIGMECDSIRDKELKETREQSGRTLGSEYIEKAKGIYPDVDMSQANRLGETCKAMHKALIEPKKAKVGEFYEGKKTLKMVKNKWDNMSNKDIAVMYNVNCEEDNKINPSNTLLCNGIREKCFRGEWKPAIDAYHLVVALDDVKSLDAMLTANKIVKEPICDLATQLSHYAYKKNSKQCFNYLKTHPAYVIPDQSFYVNPLFWDNRQCTKE